MSAHHFAFAATLRALTICPLVASLALSIGFLGTALPIVPSQFHGAFIQFAIGLAKILH